MFIIVGVLTAMFIMMVLSSLNDNIVKPIAKIKADNKREAAKDPVDKEFEKVYVKEIIDLKTKYGYYDDPEKFKYLHLNYCADLHNLKKQFLATGKVKPVIKNNSEAGSKLLEKLRK